MVLTCSVASIRGTSLEGDRQYACAQLAGCICAKVTSANTTQWFIIHRDTHYIDFGSWEGIAFTFAPNRSCDDV